ncbi:MAG: Cof-type HAD-IIB family hydrolase [Clostridiales bacterium]|nr:Cof-type HAD-IIB family hydrolase [Roseburia sp.]MDD7637637.1 Cof-type HAD-IIB family hydrolase [Clostridiales bacterium]MDY4113629.1 Cof-type HAD-IIB family hydrolase [Roseburia sp.]
MNNKILFVDLDATLLCDDKSVSKRNREAIRQMLAEGHYIALATGRPVESGRIVARELGLTLPGCYMVAFNGAVLYDCSADRVLLKRSIPIDVVQELFERAKKAGIYVQTYTNTDIITMKHTRELDYYREKSKLSYKLSDNVLDLLEEEPQKVLMIALEHGERLIKFRKENLRWEQGKCNSFFSCTEYLEYCPLDTSKGTGVEYLTQILNMPIDATVAVGDEQNDIAMLKAAHIGVAMKNGIQELKDIADYVTENDNNHDAIAEVIEKFIL